jgi:pyroglutamyl-peptidase
MRLLLTGFEPFAGATVNPSWAVVRAIEADSPSGVEVTSLELAVRGGIAFERLVPAFERGAGGGAFDAWLGLGQAGGRPQLSVERLGINLLVERDDATAALEERALVDGGPAAYFSRLPVRELAEHMAARGAPTAVSNSAGTYVCNEVTYVMQHHLASAGSGRDVSSGFIHLPYLPQQVAGKPSGTPSMALETQVLGVRAAVEFLRELVETRAPAAAGRS